MKKTLINIKYERFPEYEDLRYSGKSSKVVSTTFENLDNLIVEIKEFINELNKSKSEDSHKIEMVKSDFVKFNRFDEVGYRLTKSLYPEDYIWIHSVECVQIDDSF